MFKIYDSYFAQYTPTSRDFQYIMSGSSELAMIIKDLLKSPRCKLLTLEGIFLKPIQRLQKYPLFFKDLMSMTSKSDPDYEFLERALHNHQTELMKIDDRIWIEGHNEMLKDLQHRIKGLPMNFSLVERHRYLVLDGPVYRVTTRQPSRPFARRHGVLHHSEGYTGLISPVSEWRDGIWSPASGGTDGDSHMPFHRPSQMDYHHLHSKPAYPASPSLSSSSSSSSSSKSSSTSSLTSSPYSPTTLVFPVSAPTTPKGLMTPRSKGGGDNPFDYLSRSALNSPKSPSSLYSATTLISLSSTNGATVVAPAAPQSIPNQSPKQTVSQLIASYNSQLSSSFSNFSSITGGSGGDGCNVGGGGGGGGLSGLRGFGGQPRNVSSSALYLPGLIKNTNDAEAEYHVFVFTDIILWTKRVMSSRYHRKEGTPWHFKLVEPVSRLTSVCNTNEDNIFMCTSVNTNSTSFLVRTEDEIAARMWKTTIPTLVRYHCSRSA
ncbi:hypothetical protein BGW38_005502 [Lunasporangiospora selenospora]|uniref:DH domain-containing protein n=1 Tax=Lunasporangiospora selenospora TaxID=979761 RepID=A0A9P6FMX2_9FUNG|nr:hypothetical protein BGW38_005502 [Lunasporangiospora selenospora]